MNEFGLSDNAVKVFKETPKYCFEKETIDECFRRVAKEYARNDEDYELAYELLKSHKWRPNTPIFFNSGTKHKVFAACYVCDLTDSMNSIYDIANVARKIFQHGSGIGIPIGNLREKDGLIFEGEGPKEGFTDAVPESKSSGPITFMKLYDACAETTRSGGRVRRAAELCAMNVSHPDILDFIKCKEVDKVLSNMNISVGITDEFMDRLNTNTPFELKSVYDNKKVGDIDPNIIWDSLVEMSWKTADPGILFLDNINRNNVLRRTTTINVSNPCLEENTEIITDSGIKFIKNVKSGGRILSFSHKTGNVEFDEVVWSGISQKNVDTIKIEFDDDTFLELTDNHQIYTENRGYINASELTEKDIIISYM